MKVMSKEQIEKFAVGFPYPTNYVQILLTKYDFDTEKVSNILNGDKINVIKEIQETTEMVDGFTVCCGYDFGVDGFGNTKVRFCPLCGKKIIKII